MKTRNILKMINIALLVCFYLSGCGDGTSPSSGAANGVLQGSIPGATESEQLVSGGTVVVEGHTAGAGNDTNVSVQLLCSSGKLTPEEETLAMELMTEIYHKIELDEYVGECIHVISNETWSNVLTDNMIEGSRTFTLQQNGLPVLSIQVGYNFEGEFYSNICYKSE